MNMILLPSPEIPKEAIPEGYKIITLESLTTPHPWILGAVTNVQIIIKDDPETEAAIEEIGRTAFTTGESFRDGLKRLVEETGLRPTPRTPKEQQDLRKRIEEAIDPNWWNQEPSEPRD